MGIVGNLRGENVEEVKRGRRRWQWRWRRSNEALPCGPSKKKRRRWRHKQNVIPAN